VDKTVYDKVKTLSKLYKQEGFVIVGIFGSYVRNEQTDKSDIDILYELDSKFLEKYSGWDAILRLDEIKVEISRSLNVKADFADKSALRKVARKYILPEVVNV